MWSFAGNPSSFAKCVNKGDTGDICMGMFRYGADLLPRVLHQCDALSCNNSCLHVDVVLLCLHYVCLLLHLASMQCNSCVVNGWCCCCVDGCCSHYCYSRYALTKHPCPFQCLGLPQCMSLYPASVACPSACMHMLHRGRNRGRKGRSNRCSKRDGGQRARECQEKGHEKERKRERERKKENERDRARDRARERTIK